MKIFEPQLVLAREPDGEYTLHSVTLTPNSCYSAGKAERGIPPNVRLIPETESVLLQIRTRSGPCLQVITPVRHRVRNLKLGAKTGKTSVIAFVMLDGNIVGSASIRVDDPSVCANDPPKETPVETTGWYAWMNLQPPGPRTLYVQGIISAPTPGYDARLVPAAPQGINPKNLILDLILTPRPGMWPAVVTPIPVSYVQQSPAIAYDSVLVRLPDGEGISLTVDEIH